jgi:hypothetical protein
MVGVCISLTFWGEMDIMRLSKCPNGLGGQLETSVHNHIDVIRRTRVRRYSHIMPLMAGINISMTRNNTKQERKGYYVLP